MITRPWQEDSAARNGNVTGKKPLQLHSPATTGAVDIDQGCEQEGRRFSEPSSADFHAPTLHPPCGHVQHCDTGGGQSPR
jgi:hypothetical protein